MLNDVVCHASVRGSHPMKVDITRARRLRQQTHMMISALAVDLVQQVELLADHFVWCLIPTQIHSSSWCILSPSEQSLLVLSLRGCVRSVNSRTVSERQRRGWSLIVIG